MKRFYNFHRIKLIFASVFFSAFILSCNGSKSIQEGEVTPAKLVQQKFITDADSLYQSLVHLDSLIQFHITEKRFIETAFADSRKRYKRIEFLSEYYAPSTSEEFNGPALESVGEEFKIEPPTGFQVLEELLFPEIDTANTIAMLRQTGIMKALTKRLKSLVGTKEMTADRIFDAFRLEVARIVTLGITGFDSPVSFQSLSEASAALESMAEYASLFPKNNAYDTLILRIHSARRILDSGVSFDDFDRLEFTTRYAASVSKQFSEYQSSLKIPLLQTRRVFSSSKSFLFETGALSSLPFAPDELQDFDSTRALLGKLLFYEPALSEKGNRSCGSCHQPEKAFTDGLPRAVTLDGNRTRLRNTPTVLYSGFQASSSYDQKTIYLEDRVMYVVHSADEMNSSLQGASQRLSQSADYRQLFAKSFNGDSSVTPERISKAIAHYMRSLGDFSSRFDRYMRGDSLALNSEEKKGYNLFAGKAKCATCHFTPLFNGTVPPSFTETEAEVIGVPKDARWAKAAIDPDDGKMATNGVEINKHMFKTPTLRNVALTAPYMHNGVYKTLEEVMRFYNVGGGAGIGIDLPNQTLPGDSLKLADSEIKAIIAFMNALSDSSKHSAPKSLPALSNAMLSDRKPLLKRP